MQTFILFLTAFVPLSLYGLFVVLSKLLRHPVKFPESVPVIGPRKQALSIARASIRQITGGIKTLLDGYVKHGQYGKPFVVYDPSAQQELLVPVEHVKWFSDQPDSKLSSYGVRQERHAVKYLHMGIELSTTMHFMERLIGERLTRHLDELQIPMHDELRLCIDEVYGKNEEEWVELKVYSSFEDIVMPAMNRVFLGLPLSRDPRILTAFRRYIIALGLGTIFVGELPHIVKGVIARVIKLPLWYYRNKTLAVLTPAVEKQLALGKNSEADGSNFIWHAAKLSEKSIVGGIGATSKPEVIAEWIMSLGFAGSSSTVIQATNLILDVANCPKEWRVIERLREESEAVLTKDADWADASSFKKLVLADSTIRESLRYHPILIKGLTKEVVPSSGIQLPDGTNLPKGGWVGVPVLGIHRDEKYYPNANVFEPFRFIREPSIQKADKAASYEDELDAARPTTTYLGFGYGRHACPGRWFAVLMLKMIMSYIILNYDIESTGPVSPTKVIGDAALPPMSSTIRIRRRMSATK